MAVFLRRAVAWAGIVGVVGALATACGDDDDASSPLPSGPPVGDVQLPDLVPAAPTIIHMLRENDTGAWTIRFSSVLVNVGEGDFILDGVRTGDDWTVEQVLTYSTSGAEVVPTDATMVWGGDGHEHWHVSRVASYRFEPVDAAGEPLEGAEDRIDSKIGFCFYDSGRRLDEGPEDARFHTDGCGHEDDDRFLMGLSPGWGDEYHFSLPGQSIDVSDLPDGHYRLWAEADGRGWFRETTRDNNVTWADIDLATLPSGLRTAHVIGAGPSPE